MKEINSYINLIDSSNILKVPLTIKINNDDEIEQKIEISIIYNKIKYVGVGTDYLWADAFANLQTNLPKGIVIACCMTCKHGNMCPFGNEPGELFCTKNININDKNDLMNLFDNEDFYNHNSVSSEFYCDKYTHQNTECYTYNDYLLELHK